MDESPTDGFRRHPGWLLAVAGLVLAQAGLALVPFGPRPAAAPGDDRPLVSGRHPLHLYHGALGSQTFYRTGATACFDPSFQAGYPKTPVFDGGSRPAELFLALAGGGYRPAAYKIGLFVCLLFVPVALVVAARRGPARRGRVPGRGGRRGPLLVGPRPPPHRRRRPRPVRRRAARRRVRRLAGPVRRGVRRRQLADAGRGRGGRVVRPPARLDGPAPRRRGLLPRLRAAPRPGLAPGAGGRHGGRAGAEPVVAVGLGPLLVAAAPAHRRGRAAPGLGRSCWEARPITSRCSPAPPAARRPPSSACWAWPPWPGPGTGPPPGCCPSGWRSPFWRRA